MVGEVKYGEIFYLPVAHNELAGTLVHEDMEGPCGTQEAAYDYVESIAVENGGTFTIYECRAVQFCDEDAVRCAAALRGIELTPIDDD